MGLPINDTNRVNLLASVRDALTAEGPAPFTPGEDPVPVSGKVLDPNDYVSMVDAVLDGWLTAGRFTAEFERALAKYVGARSAVFVNSGSSANLAALSALTSPKLGRATSRPAMRYSQLRWASLQP